MDEDLFGLGIVEEEEEKPKPRITSSGRSPLDTDSYSAWDYWAKITDRPAREMPDRNFLKSYRSMRNQGFTHDSLIRNLNGASRVRPVGRDSMDVKRAIKAMTEQNAEAFAESALQEDRDVIKWIYTENAKHLCSLKDLSEALDMDIHEWNSSESDAAGIIIRTVKSEDLASAIKRTAAISGKEWVMPSDIIRWKRAWSSNKQIRAKGSDKRDTYAAGSTEREQIASLSLSVDVEAERLLLLGCPYDKIAEFHHQAPEGYWSAYEAAIEDYIVNNPESTLPMDTIREEAASEIEEDYDWKPQDREIPEW